MSPPKLVQNSRKSSGNYQIDRSSGNWKADYSGKCTKCSKHHKDNLSGDESQLLEAKTSEETFNGAISEDTTQEVYVPEGDSIDYPYENSYIKKNMNTHPEAVLEKLKELQWRRDALEHYYTCGVRKIINDYFFGDSRIPNDQKRNSLPNDEERMRAGGVKKNQSHPIRLECGCTHLCQRNRQRNQSSPMPSTSTTPHYPGDHRGRCPSRSEAIRSP